MKLKNKEDGVCIELHGEWEVVNEERWEDVTKECNAYYFTFDGRENDTALYLSNNGELVCTRKGYRLRKIEVETRHQCGKTLANTIKAFIVEKKVSE